MPVQEFIPEVWSPLILAGLRRNLVYGNCVNREYEGDIAEKGDKVNITTFVDPTIRGELLKRFPAVADNASRLILIELLRCSTSAATETGPAGNENGSPVTDAANIFCVIFSKDRDR